MKYLARYGRGRLARLASRFVWTYFESSNVKMVQHRRLVTPGVLAGSGNHHRLPGMSKFPDRQVGLVTFGVRRAGLAPAIRGNKLQRAPMMQARY